MGKEKFQGNWFIKDGKHYPGELLIDADSGKILLEIYSEETIEGYKNGITNNAAHLTHDLIYGDAPLGEITLYECELKCVSAIGRDFYKSVYSIRYVIYGIFIDDADVMVDAGEFLFPGLANWYEGWEHSQHLGALEGKLTDIDLLKSTSLKINDELEFIFTDRISSQIEEFHFSYKVTYAKTLTLHYNEAVPFKRILKDAVTFLKLLEFASGKPLNCKLLGIAIKDQAKERRNNYFRISSFHLTNNKDIPRHSSGDVHMIFSRDKLGSKDAVDALIIQWYQQEDIANIIEYYLDANNWFEDSENAVLSNVMFNNRFLNLIQGLEDYYRVYHFVNADEEAFEDNKQAVMRLIVDNRELKQWLNDTFKFTRYPSLAEKLKMIVADCIPEVRKVYGDVGLDNFAKAAAEYRNTLSHGKNKAINLGERFHLYYQIARLLLLICILKSLDQKDIKRLLYRHFKMDRNMHEILRLQQIYND